MKTIKRIISTLLTLAFVLGALTGIVTFSSVGVLAAETTDSDGGVADSGVAIEDYLTTVYNNPEEKLATMQRMLSRDGYELWVDAKSGEVAVKEVATGSILFSNPYDVASSKGSDATKKEILSQIVVQYNDNKTSKSMWSYESSAMLDQIHVQRIKNGIRVEYVIGSEDSRMLLPRWVLSESFDTYIKGPMTEALEKHELSSNDDENQFIYDKFLNFWQEYNIDGANALLRATLVLKYPILDEISYVDSDGVQHHNSLRVFQEDMASGSDKAWCESLIKQFCPDYTFEQMDADHDAAGYEAEDEQLPAFRLALEYTLDEKGMSVRLPCNGLRYDMSKYTLESISILPYIGAGSSVNAGFRYTVTDEAGNKKTMTTEGYNFFPDGSGALFSHSESKPIVTGKVYGLDFAYNEISSANITYQKTIRTPVYGVVTSNVMNTFTYTETVNKEETLVTKTISNTVKSAEDFRAELEEAGSTLLESSTSVAQVGYLAIMEDGESLASIKNYHNSLLSDYNTVINYYNPKPKDTYKIGNSMSVTTSSGSMTVVSDRKYSGNLTLRFLMLSDDAIAEKANATAETPRVYYSPSWIGMAEAYRDYLCDNGTLTKLTEADVEKGIPLYIESFGTLETQETFLTIPIDVMTPLTTFEDIRTMYEELSKRGVSNVNFKLTGFANGGMYATVPYKLKWEKAVGGSDGFTELVAFAKEVNGKGDAHLGLYPDFDFAYFKETSLFDGLRLKRDAIKTIDNRYTSYRQYSATQQNYVSFYQLAIAPSRYSYFYDKLLENYEEYQLKALSVATLGNALNSDFDEDEPYNREDSKQQTQDALADISGRGYSLMTDGGNVYTWGYLDHILNVDLDSSRYVTSYASVPFVGAVLHGYVQFAGSPLNEEGDIDYAMLRAIENGAGLYFILSYQNTDKLKEDKGTLSEYYSVRYDIWLEDAVDIYTELNELLSDVQTKNIIGHEFLVGERVLEDSELMADVEDLLKAAQEAEDIAEQNKKTDAMIEAADAWNTAYTALDRMNAILKNVQSVNSTVATYNGRVPSSDNANDHLKEEMRAVVRQLALIEKNAASYEELEADTELLAVLMAQTDRNEEEIESLNARITTLKQTIEGWESGLTQAYKNLTDKISGMKSPLIKALTAKQQLDAYLAQAEQLVEDVKAAIAFTESVSVYDETTRAKLLGKMNQYLTDAESKLDSIREQYKRYTEVSKTMKAPPLKEDSQHYILTRAIKALNYAFGTAFEEGGLLEQYAAYLDTVKEECEKYLFTEESILAVVQTSTQEEEETEVVETVNRYLVDNRKIVAVVYGDRDVTTGAKTAYKTFILNYNTFAVRVEYRGTVYTVASGGYILLND